MLDILDIENFIKKFPIYQYAFIKPNDFDYTEKVRLRCKRSCPHYGSSWSCPPAVGKIKKCRDKCLGYSDVLVFSTMTELLSGSSDEKVAAQKEHEKLTKIIAEHMMDKGYVIYVISSGMCRLCQKCTFPRDFCKHPYKMYPCIESHGVTIADLMDFCDMDHYLGGRLYFLFTLIYFKDTGFIM